MIECDKKNNWHEFLEFMQKRMNATEFENWLAPIHVLQITPDEVVLEVPNIFVREYLLENYKEALLNFFPACKGEPAQAQKNLNSENWDSENGFRR